MAPNQGKSLCAASSTVPGMATGGRAQDTDPAHSVSWDQAQAPLVGHRNRAAQGEHRKPPHSPAPHPSSRLKRTASQSFRGSKRESIRRSTAAPVAGRACGGAQHPERKGTEGVFTTNFSLVRTGGGAGRRPQPPAKRAAAKRPGRERSAGGGSARRGVAGAELTRCVGRRVPRRGKHAGFHGSPHRATKSGSAQS